MVPKGNSLHLKRTRREYRFKNLNFSGPSVKSVKKKGFSPCIHFTNY